MPELQEDTRAVRRLTVETEQAGQRIDNFLRGLLKGVPKSHIYRILRRGEVRVNKGRIRADYRLVAGDTVRVPPVRVAERQSPPRPGERVLNTLREAVLYEDTGLLVLNKPAGIAVHGGSGLSFGVIEALRVLRPDDRHLELVHRLDRETSGCLLVARKRSVLRALHEMLRGDGMDKRYVALLQGVWEGGKRRVDMALRKNVLKSGERVVRVDPEGKPARTGFVPREVFAGASLVEAKPITGRTHQIRVHAAQLGMPIAGDEKYGNEQFNRQMRALGLKRLFLHAESLAFQLPGMAQPIRVQAPLDPALTRFLESLRSTT